jgi:PAS domain S-box-containing protein
MVLTYGMEEERKELGMVVPKYSVLVLSADRQLRKSLQAMLEDAGDSAFRAEHRGSLVEGLERLAAVGCDAVLLDLNLADSQGLSTLVEVHYQFRSLPILVLVSREKETQGKQAQQAGAYDFLVKEDLTPLLLEKALLYAIEGIKARETVRQAELRFQALFDNAKDVYFTLDLEGNITSLNRAGESLFGYTREEAQGMNLQSLVAPEDLPRCCEILQRVRGEADIPPSEIALVNREGRRLLLEVSTLLLYRRGKKEGVQGIARDITERRHLEDLLRQSQKLEAIGRFSGGLAHDFNNLLCAITGHTELLTERMDAADPGQSNVAQIKKAAESAAALVRQLLAFSRQQVFYPQVVNLNEIVGAVEKLFSRLIGEHIEFVTDLAPALGRVRVDPTQIEQVLVNLVLNARDAMPEGGRLTIATSECELEENIPSRHGIVPPGRYVVLSVSDTGMGMDPGTQSRIFEPFFTTKAMGKGTGLGLATVYGIVKQSGGYIWVYSESGRGTTFKVYLAREEGPVSLAPAHKQRPKSYRGTETILLVEDAEPLRALAREFLSGSGYTVLEAANGKEALQIARRTESRIHLLLTDVIMPEIGGRQLAEQLRERDSRMAVLYMTGYSNDRMIQTGLPESGMALLEKPFTRELLLRKVRESLDTAGGAS